MAEKLKEFHSLITRLEGEKYDIERRYRTMQGQVGPPIQNTSTVGIKTPLAKSLLGLYSAQLATVVRALEQSVRVVRTMRLCEKYLWLIAVRFPMLR